MVTSPRESPGSSEGGEGKAARTRRLLRQCTLDAIAETGEFTGEGVSERAGVSTATFYAHFATKDHAIAACLDACFTEYESRMSQVETVERLLDTGLRATLAEMVATTAEINDSFRALLRMARGRIQASQLLREQSRAQERRAFAATERFIRLGQAAGQIRQVDVELLTATTRTVLDGLDTWTIRHHPDVASNEIPDLLTRYLSPAPA